MINYKITSIILLIITCTQFAVMFFFFYKIKEEKSNNLKDEGDFLNNLNILEILGEVLHSDTNKLILLLSPECPMCNEVLRNINLFNKSVLKNLVVMFVKENDEKNIISNEFVKSYKIDESIIVDDIKIKKFPYAILVKENKILKSGSITYISLIDYVSHIGA